MKDHKQEDHDVDEATINLHAKSATITEDTDASIKDTDYEAARCAVIAMGKNSGWKTIELQEFKRLFSTAETVKKSFTVVELKTILRSCHATVSSGPKTVLVNKVCGVFGDKSTLLASPKSLKQIAKDQTKAWPKAVLNIVCATNTCIEIYSDWESTNMSNGGYTTYTDEGHSFFIPRWYAQPAIWNDQPIQFIIDPHHVFVNNRCRCCTYGMGGMGIKPQTWRKVAENERENGAGLPVELVVELRDRSRN